MTPTMPETPVLLTTHPELSCCPIVELRQYTMHPGQRDVLIDLFDREFIESQEALGIRVARPSRRIIGAREVET